MKLSLRYLSLRFTSFGSSVVRNSQKCTSNEFPTFAYCQQTSLQSIRKNGWGIANNVTRKDATSCLRKNWLRWISRKDIIPAFGDIKDASHK